MTDTYKPLPKGAKIILKEKENCKSIKEISNKTGYKISTIYYYLCCYGKQHEIKTERKQRILNELKKGQKQSYIARKNKVSRQYVSKLKMELKND